MVGRMMWTERVAVEKVQEGWEEVERIVRERGR